MGGPAGHAIWAHARLSLEECDSREETVHDSHRMKEFQAAHARLEWETEFEQIQPEDVA